jgi:hypothetical protein
MSVPLGVILNRSITFLDARTCVIPHCAIDESTCSWLAV